MTLSDTILLRLFKIDSNKELKCQFEETQNLFNYLDTPQIHHIAGIFREQNNRNKEKEAKKVLTELGYKINVETKQIEEPK